MKKLQIRPELPEVSKAIHFIMGYLEKHKIPKAKQARTILAAEEILVEMINHTEKDTSLQVTCLNFFGNVSIRFRAKGSRFDAGDIEKRLLFGGAAGQPEAGGEFNEVLSRLAEKILGSGGDGISIRNDRGYNKAVLRVTQSRYSSLVRTLFAFAAGILFGLVLHNLPAQTSGAVTKNLLTPVYTVYLNALKMVVAPLVFCSIASSIADFNDIRSLGRIAGKICAAYTVTSVIAILIGAGAYRLFPIGNPSLALAVTDAAGSTIAKGQAAEISIISTLVNIVPSDIITPFQKSDMLQIIFLALLAGLSASAIAAERPEFRNLLNTLNYAVSWITARLVALIPAAVFCSMAKMMVSMQLPDLANVLVWIPAVYLADLAMIGAYLLLLLLTAGLNPLVFLRKYFPAMISAFTLSSSNAALPTSVRQCESLGVARKIYSFSLPLGATINMDGSCVTLIITALFMAKIFGISVTGNVWMTLFIAIIVLSMGAPGVPGGNLVCITLLLPQIGVPAEAVSLIMGLYPLISMMQTCVNVTGDAAVTTIVAKSEQLLDRETYYS